MNELLLEDVKAHLRVTHCEEDNVIYELTTAAEHYVRMYLGDNIEEEMPAPVKAAVMLLVGDLYTNRERQVDRQLFQNTTYSLLLGPYRSMEFC